MTASAMVSQRSEVGRIRPRPPTGRRGPAHIVLLVHSSPTHVVQLLYKSSPILANRVGAASSARLAKAVLSPALAATAPRAWRGSKRAQMAPGTQPRPGLFET